MTDCKHEQFFVHADVHRLQAVEGGDVTAFSVDITITCEQCQTPFKFLGLGVGMSSLQPMTDVPGTTLRAPLVPVGREDMVSTMPGYEVRMRGPGNMLPQS